MSRLRLSEISFALVRYNTNGTLDATFSSYQVDRAEFISLFDAEVELLEFERTIRRATVDGLIAIANIELLIGKELP